MVRLSMNERTTYRWSFDEDVRGYAAAGLDGIAIWRQKLSDFGEEKGMDLLAESGLAVSSLMWAGGFTGSDGRTYKESVEDARDAIRLAATLRAACLIVYSGARAGHTHNHARRLLRSALAELTPAAEEMGVVLAIEPMHAGCAAEWTFLTDADETIALVDEFDSPSVKMVFDTYHLAQDAAAMRWIADIAPRTAIVQLGDAKAPPCGEQNRCRLGDGAIPLAEIIPSLSAAGYNGFYDVKLMGEEIEACEYEELLEQSKRTFENWLAAGSAS